MQVLGNRCAAYLKVGRHELALGDAQRCTEITPDWPKGWYIAPHNTGFIALHCTTYGSACEENIAPMRRNVR